MRIIGGNLRSRRIPVPKHFKARPTTDFAKEGLFNILNNYIYFQELVVLELFSGTGSISFEFASRGCPEIDLVENNFSYCSFINKTAHNLGLMKITVHQSDVFRYINTCNKKYNLIFADPPYEMKNIELIPDLIIEKGLLTEDGILILEHSGKYQFSANQHFRELRNYGSVHFSFFRI